MLLGRRKSYDSQRLQDLSSRESILAHRLGKYIAIHYGYTPASLAVLETLIHGDGKEVFFAAVEGALLGCHQSPTKTLWQSYFLQQYHRAYPTDVTARAAKEGAAERLGQLRHVHRDYRKALKKALDNTSVVPFQDIRNFIQNAQTLMEYSHVLKPAAQRRLSNRILCHVTQTRALVLQDSSQTFGIKEGLLEFFNPRQPADDTEVKNLKEQLALLQVIRASQAPRLAQPA